MCQKTKELTNEQESKTIKHSKTRNKCTNFVILRTFVGKIKNSPRLHSIAVSVLI